MAVHVRSRSASSGSPTHPSLGRHREAVPPSSRLLQANLLQAQTTFGSRRSVRPVVAVIVFAAAMDSPPLVRPSASDAEAGMPRRSTQREPIRTPGRNFEENRALHGPVHVAKILGTPPDEPKPASDEPESKACSPARSAVSQTSRIPPAAPRSSAKPAHTRRRQSPGSKLPTPRRKDAHYKEDKVEDKVRGSSLERYMAAWHRPVCVTASISQSVVGLGRAGSTLARHT